MDQQPIEELLPFYALDALTEEERELVEAFLAEHTEARPQLQEMDKTVSALPHSVAPVEPPRHVKAGLMSRVAADNKASAPSAVPASPQRASRKISLEDFFRLLSFAVATLAIVWAIVLNMQVGRLQNEISALNDRLTAQAESLEELITNLPQNNPSAVITVSLKGTDVQPQVQGQLITDPESQSAVLVISGLPRLEAGKTYQVWLIDGGQPVSAGLLTVDETGQGIFIVTSEESIGSFATLGISIEPEGGSPQPTGEIVVLSDL